MVLYLMPLVSFLNENLHVTTSYFDENVERVKPSPFVFTLNADHCGKRVYFYSGGGRTY